MTLSTVTERSALLRWGVPVAGCLAFLAAVLIWTGWVSCGFDSCPDPHQLEAYQAGGSPVLLDRNGEELAAIHPLEMHVVVLDSLPAHVPNAFVAVEDRRFYRHDGVDWIRVVRAMARNVAAGRVREGASTITMQLARTLFPERIPGAERTIRRKLVEIRMADRIERRFTKAEILELYLNHVYVGGGAYGVEAGARYYFGKPAAELTPEESALLAAVVRAPANYDPRRHPERALQRRNLVLTLLERQEWIPPAQARAARTRSLHITEEPPTRSPPGVAPYFIDTVRRFLQDEFGEGLYRSRIRVYTTLDPNVQRVAEEELLLQLSTIEEGTHGVFDPRRPDSDSDDSADQGPLQGAMVILEPHGGEVLAMVGGRDFGTSRFNRAVLARRQIGSAFKPFVYAAALKEGYVMSQPLDDRPVRVSQVGSSDWSPRNYDGRFRGPVSMRRAIVESLNVPTVRLALAVGMDEVVRTALQAGVPEPLLETPATALGTTSLSPLELAGAYTGFATGGGRTPPRIMTRIESSAGEVLFESEAQVEEALDPRIAYLVTDMLSDVVDRGTGAAVREAGFTGPAAGKTGTTQEGHDAWFVGYTPQLVGSVWIGFDRPRPIMVDVTGGRIAAPIWGNVMRRIYEDQPDPPSWTRPDGIVERLVEPGSGRLIEDGCSSGQSNVVQELFLEERIPTSTCPAIDQLPEHIAAFFKERGREAFAPGEADVRDGEDSDAITETSHWDRDTGPDRILGAQRVPLEREGGRDPDQP